MIVQIYEITTVAEAMKMAELGVDHVGIVVGKGAYKNEISPLTAKEIFLSLPQQTKGSALTLSTQIDEILETIKESEPDILHLASTPEKIPPPYIEKIKQVYPKIEVMRTIPVSGEESVAAAMVYDGICDYLLLDTKDESTGLVGITGKTHDWNISKKIVESVNTKVILAGGLGLGNVVKAIGKVRPDGVDSKTKTDKIGGKGKDYIKVKRFVDLAKSTQ